MLSQRAGKLRAGITVTSEEHCGVALRKITGHGYRVEAAGFAR